MDLAVYVPMVMPLLAAAAAGPLAELLPPRTATWLLAGSAVGLAGASCAVLGLLALAAALHRPFVAAAGGISLPAVERADPASLPLGIIAGVLFGVAAMATLRATLLRTAAMIRARRRTRRMPRAGRMPGAAEAIVITDDRVDAYTVPGWPSKIVITSGMLNALSQRERDVMLAHERAHASACHYLFTAAARLAAAANPLLIPLAMAVSYSVERWADERAAAVAGSRPLAARAIAKAALAASASPGLHPAGALSLLPDRLLPRSAGLIPRRVAALLGPPPKRRLLLVAIAVGLVVVTCLAAVDAAADLHSVIEFAQAAAAS